MKDTHIGKQANNYLIIILSLKKGVVNLSTKNDKQQPVIQIHTFAE